ncbi:MAG: DUF853 family protein, partial [Gammaproteobacteria bacterium]|nr:DUF853 family protein [Gammaproteobacteria bacterium]
MQTYEKMGAFYLGKTVDVEQDKVTDELVLYDAKDLTTHGVIIGMTGSGKTGLGVGLIEEAALDKVPVIAIDPKGDLGNLLLTFPEFKGEQFEPWVNARQAEDKGQSVADYASEQAQFWQKGLDSWGQDGERVQRLKDSAEFTIYTPGSDAGVPISVLNSFAAPSDAVRNDADAYREHLQSTTTGVLTLLGIDADPLTSREHILISNVLDHMWQQGRDLGIEELIGAIQQPPMKKIGVMAVDDVFPAKDRFKLAMQINNLLASPGFEAWRQGVALDAQKLLYTDSGKPRVSVISIAHLNDNERMFFVTLLLSELVGWMRSQAGTSS